MDSSQSITSTVRYGRDVINAGFNGVRKAVRDECQDVSPCNLALAAAKQSVKFAALGACIGLFGSLVVRRRSSLTRHIASGSLGMALGFSAGLLWNTRGLTSSIAHSAAAEIQQIQDEHWLKAHPIDYA
jgi:hypothetical protein